jgi:hypothetical protein
MIDFRGCEWKGKQIGIATDGAINMTGRHSGAVTRLAIGTCPDSIASGALRTS